DQLNEVTEKKLSEKAVIRKKKGDPMEQPVSSPDGSNEGAAVERVEVLLPATGNDPEIAVGIDTGPMEPAPVSLTEQAPIDTPRIVSSPSPLQSKAIEETDIDEMRKALEASRQQVEQMKQELKVGQGQIQALKNRENNLILQLNQAVEFRKQQNDRT